MTIRQINFSNLHRILLFLFIAVCPIFYYNGRAFGSQTLRLGQEQFFQLGITVLIIFLIDNVYLGLFLAWSVFLYAFFNFTTGGVYVMNLMMACLLYHITYKFLDPKDIKTVFKILLGLCVLNVIWMLMQYFDFELIWKRSADGAWARDLVGLMGIKAALGMLFALCIPLACYFHTFLGILLFIPMYFSQSSNALVAGMIGLLFHLYHRSKKLFAITLLLCIFAGGYYVSQDSKANMFTNRFNLWKVSLRDAFDHPIAGWGLDSFRNINPVKNFMYFENAQTNQVSRAMYEDGKFNLSPEFIKPGQIADPWDNPHNLFVSLMFEFGLFGIVILTLLVIDIFKRFNAYVPEQLALLGFMIVLLVLSIGQFPFFLTRIGYLAPVMYALYMKITSKGDVL